MELLTWGELKKMAEQAGFRDDDPIFYLDVHMPYRGEDLVIQPPQRGPDGRLAGDSVGAVVSR